VSCLSIKVSILLSSACSISSFFFI
jgi:hypothetical protein